MDTITLAIIEDDPVVQEGLTTFLSIKENLQLLTVSDSVESFFEWTEQTSTAPGILLLDINLPGISGLEGIPQLLKTFPELDIIMLTTFEDADSIFSALKLGACSYISKQTPLHQIGEVIDIVAEGGSYMSPAIARKVAGYFVSKKDPLEELTDRQRQIVDLIVEGKSYKMIAAELFISLDTVRHHIKKIYRALKINSNTELVKKALGN